MTLYTTIEEAIVALTEKYGLSIFSNTNRFIALLSDYAPNLMEQQHTIRLFARAGGYEAICGGLSKNSDSALFAKICEKAVCSTKDINQQRFLVRANLNILKQIGKCSANALDGDGVFAQGMNYFRAFPKEKNIPIALLLFEEASTLGNSGGLYYIASSYLKGKGVPQDTTKGIKTLEQSAETGDIRAVLELAKILLEGQLVEKNVTQAVVLLKTVDDPNALFMLGDIYRTNFEYTKALDYYRQAAERGHVYAQYSTAIAYAIGQGTKRDIQTAKKWLRSAASLGHSDARQKLEELGEKWD